MYRNPHKEYELLEALVRVLDEAQSVAEIAYTTIRDDDDLSVVKGIMENIAVAVGNADLLLVKRS